MQRRQLRLLPVDVPRDRQPEPRRLHQAEDVDALRGLESLACGLLLLMQPLEHEREAEPQCRGNVLEPVRLHEDLVLADTTHLTDLRGRVLVAIHAPLLSVRNGQVTRAALAADAAANDDLAFALDLGDDNGYGLGRVAHRARRRLDEVLRRQKPHVPLPHHLPRGTCQILCKPKPFCA